MSETGNKIDEQEYDLIAPFYDIEHAHFSEDLDLYRDFAEMYGPYGPILELACGSGRLLVPLAQEGYKLVGVDNSNRMLELARQRLEQEGGSEHVRLVQQNIRTFQLEQQYRLAFIALGSFAHITTRKDQEETLTSIRTHLTTGGTLILDISNADARYLEQMSNQILHQGTWHAADQSVLTHLISPTAAVDRHLLELTHFYDQHQQGGNLQRTVITTYLYLFERNEIELLLERAGFTIKDVYGNYDLSPFELSSPRLIIIAEAR